MSDTKTNQGIKGFDVRMFPSSLRSTVVDRNASLPTESNLTSLVDRLTLPCFIIKGLNVDNNTIEAGSMSMAGYIFYITKDIKIDPNLTKSGYLAFHIRVQLSVIGSRQNRLVGFDVEDEVTEDKDGNPIRIPVTDVFLLDPVPAEPDGIFTGLELKVLESLPQDMCIDTDIKDVGMFRDYYLCLAQCIEGNWQELRNVDGEGETRPLEQKFKLCDIRYGGFTSGPYNYYRNGDKPQDLSTYLSTNIVIDGGEIL